MQNPLPAYKPPSRQTSYVPRGKTKSTKTDHVCPGIIAAGPWRCSHAFQWFWRTITAEAWWFMNVSPMDVLLLTFLQVKEGCCMFLFFSFLLYFLSKEMVYGCGLVVPHHIMILLFPSFEHKARNYRTLEYLLELMKRLIVLFSFAKFEVLIKAPLPHVGYNWALPAHTWIAIFLSFSICLGCLLFSIFRY